MLEAVAEVEVAVEEFQVEQLEGEVEVVVGTKVLLVTTAAVKWQVNEGGLITTMMMMKRILVAMDLVELKKKKNMK